MNKKKTAPKLIYITYSGIVHMTLGQEKQNIFFLCVFNFFSIFGLTS